MTKLDEGDFKVWLTLPLAFRPRLRGQAGLLGLAMSEFSRRAVEEAVRRAEAGEDPFQEKSARRRK